MLRILYKEHRDWSVISLREIWILTSCQCISSSKSKQLIGLDFFFAVVVNEHMAFHMLLKSSITEIHPQPFFLGLVFACGHIHVGGTVTHGHVWKPEIDIQMLFSIISPSYILIQSLPWIWRTTIWLESLNSYPLPLSMVCLFLHPPHQGYSPILQCMQFLRV